jgi:(1->4)-alpha-D-glucan 1-alpha-D-glucosylmutase
MTDVHESDAATLTDPAHELDRLARCHGILPDYRDVWGRQRQVADQTKRAVLDAMGVPCGDAETVRRALERQEAERTRRLLQPVLVLEETRDLQVPVGLPDGNNDLTLSWRIVEEHGNVHEGESPVRDLGVGSDATAGRTGAMLALDLRLPAGYHELRVKVADRQAGMSLIITPEHCYLPEALLADARWWGLTVQLYSVRRAHDWGMGDFSALPPLLDLCAGHGAAMLGLSPLHAMFPGWPEHASPYSPSSRLFLNVLYIDLEGAADVTGSAAARERMSAEDTAARLEQLRAANLVDYQALAAVKLPLLELAFAEFAAAPSSLRYQQFRQFCDAEGDLLLRHALFEALQEHFHGLDPASAGWPHWPRPYQDPASAAVTRFAQTHAQRVDFFRWLQWLAEEQLTAAARYAEDRDLSVGLYLDLAVSVDRNGAETWCNRHLYALDATVGAPPDLINVKGQNWGLPPLNPQSLFESGYALFVNTLRRNMRHAGAMRIDHVMGLMRLYWIPRGGEPDAGAYVSYPVDDLLGIVALESQRNRCMVIGEDLGTVPDGLSERMNRLRILSYRLLYFEQSDQGHFRSPEDYPALAAVAVSTHDLPTLRGWWHDRDLEWRSRLDLYPNEEMRQSTEHTRSRDRRALVQAFEDQGLTADDKSMQADPAVAVHRFLARTPAMLLLVQLEDALGLAEQANLPGTVDEHPNWRRRIPVAVEALEEQARFREVMAAVGEARRSPVASVLPVSVLPRATYRLQLNRSFTFDDARELVPYLNALGISHAYASPYLQSRAGSIHGYDITDHDAIDPEIGSRHAHGDWVAALQANGMGHILDIVPNHMGVMGDDNAWWLDVLEHGEAARHSRFFDIDWHPTERALAGRVLLPVLGAAYGEILDRGELVLAFDAADGRLVVRYYEHLFPIDPREYPLVLNSPVVPRPDAVVEVAPASLTESAQQELASISAAFAKLPRRSETSRGAVAERYRDSELLRQRLLKLYREVPAVAHHIEAQVASFNIGRTLHELLERQAWRLAHWRTASDEINYRRFFDINDLAGLRTQDPEVFEAVHRRVLALVARGTVSGLRVDHPDGLYDPAGYFSRLRERVAEVRVAEARVEGQGAAAPPILLLAEKILAVDETLPEDWNISGTTGYDFGAAVNGLFVEPQSASAMSRTYARFTGTAVDVEDLAYRCKLLVMQRLLAGELQVLGNRLHRIGQADPNTRDYTRNSLVEALREVVACFPVYRTYVRGPRVSEQDRGHIDTAIRRARRRSAAADPGVFDFVHDVLLQRGAGSPGRRKAMQDFTMKLQQFTAPVTAKGVEDTLFYRYARLLSLNEVGDEPSRFGVSVEDFHRRNAARLSRWPDSMLSTSSHDSKRGEDMRARLNVLSELPREWRDRVEGWRRRNQPLAGTLDGEPAPSANDEYFLYQTLLGSWPLERLDESGLDVYRGRIQAYMIKVVREAKLHTSWIAPNAAYENALHDFVQAVLDPARSGGFLDDLQAFKDQIAPLGLFNGLSQTVLKLTAPGVPDIYQGSELWNFDLVDPDNRRPVDYPYRRQLLQRLGSAGSIVAPPQLLDAMTSGLPKLYVIRQVLKLRSRLPRLFERGDYLPLPARGELARHLCAFARRDDRACVVVVVPRLCAGLGGSAGEPPLGARWRDTGLELPVDFAPPGGWLVDVFTGARQQPHNLLPVERVLAEFPVAVLAGGLDAATQGGTRS